ncbi:MAG: hypothetical protein LBV80_11390 [Deltaproteobacteria bacterium]|jgi:hypothetical protein|nr:hypothetical protein [Deltaproteobacteria bacterium]
MDKIGLVNRFTDSLETVSEAYLLVHTSQEVKKYNAALDYTLKQLKDVKATKDIKLILSVEEIMLRQEQAAYVNSPEESTSVATALNQIQEARTPLSIVADHDNYKLVASALSSAKKEAGLPVDAFRDFLKSHLTRLNNRMTSNISVPEKNIVRQRQENLGMMREIYISMQHQALGLPAL